MFDLYQFEWGDEGCYANAWGDKHLRNRLTTLIKEAKDSKIKFINEYSSQIIENLAKPGELDEFGIHESIQDALNLLNTFTDEFLEWKIEKGRLILAIIEEPNKELENYDHTKPKKITVQTELLFFEPEELAKIISKGEASIQNVWTLHHSECKGPDYIEKGIHIVNILGYCVMSEQIDLLEEPYDPEENNSKSEDDN